MLASVTICICAVSFSVATVGETDPNEAAVVVMYSFLLPYFFGWLSHDMVFMFSFMTSFERMCVALMAHPLRFFG